MKYVKYSSIILAIGLLTGCTTPYQPRGVQGGYSEMQLNEHIYQVTFNGNYSTSRQLVQKYLLYRAAELTQQKGYRYFAIMKGDNYADESSYVSPTTISGGYAGSAIINHGAVYSSSKHTATVVIKLTNEQSDAAFNAEIIINNMQKNT